MEKRFQNYRGTWAWLAQRISAIVLFFLIPVKIYTGWAAHQKVPFPEEWVHSYQIHFNAVIDSVLLFCFLLHAFYGARIILIDLGLVREDTYFWRTLAAALALFGLTVWFVYFRHHA